MKSIKPGRGPSMMSGIGSIFVIVFGIIWVIIAFSMGSRVGGIGLIFPLFGVLLVGMAVVQAVYHFKNATSENRYSAFDITEDGEESDPLNERFGTSGKQNTASSFQSTKSIYCPYCGVKLETGFAFCNQCGKKLP